jgi:hypothetical protein
MKMHRLFAVLTTLILLACLYGVQGQYTTPDSGYSTMPSAYSTTSSPAPSTVSQYSQYYSMTGQKTHITAPQKYQVTGNMPSTLYFSGQQQAVPYSQYQSYATYTGGNSLWIQGATSWTQYATVPQGASLSLLAISATGSNGYLYEIYPNGQLMTNYYYFFPGYNVINFYADTIGPHILLFSINGQVSNAIVINVVQYYPPTYQQPSYPMSGSYPSSNYASATIRSSLKGYNVYMDGNYVTTEGTTGLMDGIVTITIPGGMSHKITISKGGYSKSSSMYFASGKSYNMNL